MFIRFADEHARERFLTMLMREKPELLDRNCRISKSEKDLVIFQELSERDTQSIRKIAGKDAQFSSDVQFKTY